ncbi:hypothetical protein QVH35_08555 [Candidatus Nitrosotenuis chungbukensis]|nr:hypothetical protein [Candidatus Nitrosotenuis chungbukensis]WKT57436.1 hypothetical protein QVH35_08555 [Candidatus Nitrosotenuis chungbukensis]
MDNCKSCGKSLEGMPPDSKYCSLECAYGIAGVAKERAVFP